MAVFTFKPVKIFDYQVSLNAGWLVWSHCLAQLFSRDVFRTFHVFLSNAKPIIIGSLYATRSLMIFLVS